MKHNNTFNILFILLIVCFSACNDKWEEHNKLSGEVSQGSVFDQISNTSELSTFANYLVKTGYDKVLKADLSCTVWAPNNDAFTGIDADILNDTVQLRVIIGNHIGYQLHLAQTINTSVIVDAINGKQINWVPKALTIEDANITSSNKLCKNGVLHIINKVIIPKKNIWDLINSSELKTLTPNNANFLTKYNYLFFDEAASRKIGVNELGKNVYDSVKYKIYRFLNEVADLRDEKEFFTYFILTDNAFNDQYLAYKKYFKLGADSANRDSLTWFNICKDYAFRGKIAINDTLITADSVKVPIDKSAIIDTIQASNGVIYVLNKSTINIMHKLKTIVIQGESSDRFLFNTTKFNSYTDYRVITDTRASGFQYVYLNMHLFPDNYFQYTTTLNACKYKVYWVAIYFLPKPSNVYQRCSIMMNNIETAVSTKLQTETFTETYLADYTALNYGEALVRAKTALAQTNAIALDYIKLVPVLP